MRTQLLFGLALLCGGAVASAQQPPAPVPGYPGGDGVIPAVHTDAASSFRQYATASSKAASAASDDDNKPATDIQLTSGASGLLANRVPRQIMAAPAPEAPVAAPGCAEAPVTTGVVSSAGGSSAGGSDPVAWISASGIAAWSRAVRLPTPLVTTSTVGPGERFAGALRLPGTSILFNDKLDFDTYFGGQVELGVFLEDSKVWSADVKGFYVSPDNVSFSVRSDGTGTPFITRPFFNLAERREGAVFDAKPGVAAGGADLTAESEVYGFEVNTRANFGGGSGEGVRGNVLVGYRYLRLMDRLTIVDTLNPLIPNAVSYRGQPVNPPNTLSDFDSFKTTNDFNGIQIGGQVSVEASWLVATAYAKLAIGVTSQKADISGATTLITPAGNDVSLGGVLALPSNIGSRTVDVFGLIPEWGLTLGAAVTQNLRVTAGYSFLLWNRVVRPGDAIDRGLNPALIPTDGSFGTPGGPDRPSPRFSNIDNVYWLHAFSAGVELLF